MDFGQNLDINVHFHNNKEIRDVRSFMQISYVAFFLENDTMILKKDSGKGQGKRCIVLRILGIVDSFILL